MSENNKEAKVSNAYPDEQDKLDTKEKIEMEFALKLRVLLDDYGMAITPKLVDGAPTIEFIQIK